MKRKWFSLFFTRIKSNLKNNRKNAFEVQSRLPTLRKQKTDKQSMYPVKVDKRNIVTEAMMTELNKKVTSAGAVQERQQAID